MDDIREIVRECHSDSVKWFGDELAMNLPHMALALAGEVGELCNIIKKLQRKDFDINQPEIQNALAEETTDVFIYLCNIAHLLGVDLGRAYDTKRAINAERFGGEVPDTTQPGTDGAASERLLRSVPPTDGEG